jgi:hypothetical protein
LLHQRATGVEGKVPDQHIGQVFLNDQDTLTIFRPSTVRCSAPHVSKKTSIPPAAPTNSSKATHLMADRHSGSLTIWYSFWMKGVTFVPE